MMSAYSSKAAICSGLLLFLIFKKTSIKGVSQERWFLKKQELSSKSISVKWWKRVQPGTGRLWVQFLCKVKPSSCLALIITVWIERSNLQMIPKCFLKADRRSRAERFVTALPNP